MDAAVISKHIAELEAKAIAVVGTKIVGQLIPNGSMPARRRRSNGVRFHGVKVAHVHSTPPGGRAASRHKGARILRVRASRLHRTHPRLPETPHVKYDPAEYLRWS